MSYCAQATRRFSSWDRGSRAGWMLLLAVLLPCAAWCSPAAAAPRGFMSGDPRSQRQAVEAIPFDDLTEEAQAKLWSVVSRPTLYRKMPTTVIESDPDMYMFLVRYPEVIVNMWDLMGITKVTVNRTDEYSFQAADGAGTVSQVELIYGDRGVHVMYAEGSYQGPLFRRLISGRCVLVLQTGYGENAGHGTRLTNRLDIFVQLDNVGAELVAKTLHPLVGNTADRNFVESTNFLAQVSKAAATKPLRMQQLSQRLTKVKPEVRQKFSTLAATVSQRAGNGQAAANSVVPPVVLQPAAPLIGAAATGIPAPVVSVGEADLPRP